MSDEEEKKKAFARAMEEVEREVNRKNKEMIFKAKEALRQADINGDGVVRLGEYIKSGTGEIIQRIFSEGASDELGATKKNIMGDKSNILDKSVPSDEGSIVSMLDGINGTAKAKAQLLMDIFDGHDIGLKQRLKQMEDRLKEHAENYSPSAPLKHPDVDKGGKSGGTRQVR